MGIIKKISWTISVLFACLVIYGGLYVYSLYQVEVSDLRVGSIQDISLSGFTLGGELDVYNGGLIGVEISKIDYSLVLDETGDSLASGSVQGGKISAKKTASFSFSNKIDWVPTAELAKNLIKSGKTYATLSGIVYMDLGIVDIKKPFREEKIDLEEYVRQFIIAEVEDAIEEAAGAVTDTIEKIGDGLKAVTGNIIKGIGEFFD